MKTAGQSKMRVMMMNYAMQTDECQLFSFADRMRMRWLHSRMCLYGQKVRRVGALLRPIYSLMNKTDRAGIFAAAEFRQKLSVGGSELF